MLQSASGGGMVDKSQFRKAIKRFVTMNEAKSAGAYNITKMTFPPDHWGTQVSLFLGTVKERIVREY